MRRAFLSLALVACLAAGCGSDDDSGDKGAGSSTGTQTAAADSSKTRQRFIAEADAVCEQSNASARTLNTRLQQTFRGASSEAEGLKTVAPLMDEGIATQAKYQQQLHQLEPPPADRQTWNEMLQDTDRLVTLQKRMAVAAHAGDTEKFSAATDELESVRANARSAAQDFGFKECGSDKNEADSGGESGSAKPDGTYPAAAERNFMKACQGSSGAKKRYCECALAKLEQRVSYKEFLEEDAAIRRGAEPSRKIQRVLAACR